MSWKCWFGNHKLKVTTSLRQELLNQSGERVGYDVYIIKKCERCHEEFGYKVDHLRLDIRQISVDYIKAVYMENK